MNYIIDNYLSIEYFNNSSRKLQKMPSYSAQKNKKSDYKQMSKVYEVFLIINRLWIMFIYNWKKYHPLDSA